MYDYSRRRGYLQILVVIFAISLPIWFSSQALGDEIYFQGQVGAQTGTVVDEDEMAVTIRFPRTAIKSIAREKKKASNLLPGEVLWEEKGGYLILRIPRSRIRVVTHDDRFAVEALEQEPRSRSSSKEEAKGLKAKTEPLKGDTTTKVQKEKPSSTHETTQAKLIREEMGRVEGVVSWNGRPLDHGKVQIVMESYTGFSWAALMTIFQKNKKDASKDGVVLTTETDADGRYVFSEVPPGYYRFYWEPEGTTGWIQRLREKPDLEVLPGKLTVQTIPAKKK